MDTTLQNRLGAIVGAGNVLAADADVKPYFTDWRKQYSARADCVVRPASSAEVSGVVALCARENVAVVPQGGNTSLSGGSVPAGARREIVLSLSRMNRIRSIDPLNDTMTVEAGCVLAAVQRAADDAGRFFALSLAAEGSCQIGGNLSTNAGGVNVLRYGMARDQVLGLEVVLPDGQVWNGLRGLRKDNTGYDLKQLFLGAEGTLGIITAAVLRLHPKPTASATAWIALDNPRRAVELLAALRERVGERLSAFELISRACLEAVLAHAKDLQDPLPAAHPWYVLAELADSGDAAALRERVEQALADCAEGGALRDAVLAQSLTQARTLWRIRESIPEAQFTNVKHDVSVPVSRTPELIERVQAALDAAFPAAMPYVFGHVGDGNLHYNIGPASLLERRAEVNRIVYEAVSSLGGSISAEHGLGQLKREEILRHKSPLEIELMRTVKRALDPKGLMNPGKLL
jgi:FAD/FMN-containing dehydrogenase